MTHLKNRHLKNEAIYVPAQHVSIIRGEKNGGGTNI